MVAIANPSLACIPEEKFLIGTSKKSCNSANSIISSKCSSINFLECPSTVPFKNTFSLAVIFISNPAPNSINGAMVPFVVTEPLYGFKIPQQAFKSVDFPDPFVPISPHASPLFTFKLTSFNARNSWNINSCLISLITYSFRLSTFSDAMLNRIVRLSTSTIYSSLIRPSPRYIK